MKPTRWHYFSRFFPPNPSMEYQTNPHFCVQSHQQLPLCSALLWFLQMEQWFSFIWFLCPSHLTLSSGFLLKCPVICWQKHLLNFGGTRWALTALDFHHQRDDNELWGEITAKGNKGAFSQDANRRKRFFWSIVRSRHENSSTLCLGWCHLLCGPLLGKCYDSIVPIEWSRNSMYTPKEIVFQSDSLSLMMGRRSTRPGQVLWASLTLKPCFQGNCYWHRTGNSLCPSSNIFVLIAFVVFFRLSWEFPYLLCALNCFIKVCLMWEKGSVPLNWRLLLQAQRSICKQNIWSKLHGNKPQWRINFWHRWDALCSKGPCNQNHTNFCVVRPPVAPAERKHTTDVTAKQSTKMTGCSRRSGVEPKSTVNKVIVVTMRWKNFPDARSHPLRGSSFNRTTVLFVIW